jgi:GTP cyclohydrolase II
VKVRRGARLSCICRKHDEHNGFDVLGSDICMCRPYLRHGIEVCARKRTVSAMRQEIVRVELATLLATVECYSCETNTTHLVAKSHGTKTLHRKIIFARTSS